MLACAPFALLAAWLRGRGLGRQILGGDELHAVRAALLHSPAEILSTLAVGDYCLPLTALAGWLADLGLPLSELSLRAPSWLAGVLLVALVPLLLAELFGASTAVVFAAAAAVSPWLVYYARVARSYAPALLVALAAVALLALAERRRASAPLVGWAVLAALATWLFPLAGAFVVAPWCWSAARTLAAGAGRRAERARLFGAGALCALLLVALAWPARASIAGTFLEKAGRGKAPIGAWLEGLVLLGGVRPLAATLVLLALATVGWVRLARRAPGASALFAVAAAAQVAAVALVAPYGLAHPAVVGRYLLPLAPLLLLGVAAAVAALAERARRPLPVAGALAALLAAALAAAAPAGALGGAISFAGHAGLLWLPARTRLAPPPPLPAAYREEPAAGARILLEAPFPARWDTTRSVYEHARTHRRRVVLGTHERLFDPRRTRFRTLVPLTPAALLASDADVLVLHLRPDAEENAAARRVGLPLRPFKQAELARARAAAERLATRLRRRWGPPDRAGGDLEIWDLRRLRARRPAEPKRG